MPEGDGWTVAGVTSATDSSRSLSGIALLTRTTPEAPFAPRIRCARADPPDTDRVVVAWLEGLSWRGWVMHSIPLDSRMTHWFDLPPAPEVTR